MNINQQSKDNQLFHVLDRVNALKKIKKCAIQSLKRTLKNRKTNFYNREKTQNRHRMRIKQFWGF